MVFFRREKDGSYKKFAGWGHLFGDYGSAFNFGREAICAAKAYEDGIESIIGKLIISQMTNKATYITHFTGQIKQLGEIT